MVVAASIPASQETSRSHALPCGSCGFIGLETFLSWQDEFSSPMLIAASPGTWPRARGPGIQPQCLGVGVRLGTEGFEFSLLWPLLSESSVRPQRGGLV